ncbi:MAG TPA: respiratory nitrate reductase subunit gamma [Smithellaceae bacterium]|nr:respiratory nitrate reductase subunit gamma [Smithellaceae bacterium]
MEFYIFSYLCAVIFLAAVACRIYRQLTLPVHLRWEIYPVQHEPAGKAAYGGSYMEELNWWEKKREGSPVNELLYMAPEILLMRGLWKENKKLWRVSFPFHLGLYLMPAAFALLLISAALTLLGFAENGIVAAIVEKLIVAAAWIGVLAGAAGSLGMLYRRLTDREMRAYATVADYFNLVFILMFFTCAFLALLAADPLPGAARSYMMGLLTAGAAVPAYTPGQSLPGALTIVLGSLLMAYIPLTHMSHMFMKYFLYHRVKWDDEPNRPGSPLESALKKNLEFRPTWKAGHIDADGKKTWRDIAASAPKEMK